VVGSARLRWRAAALAIGVALVASTAACSGDHPDDLPPPASPAAPGSVATTVDPAHREILDAYHGAVEAMVAAQRAGDRDHPDLTRYYGDGTPALRDVRFGIDRHDQRGTYYEGDIAVVSAEVAELDLAGDPPLATISACLDDTDYRLVYREDGAPVPDTTAGGRYSVTSTALLHEPDDQWYIVENIAHWDEPC
jgi:hypothetical protein